jgi:hypothetical protein
MVAILPLAAGGQSIWLPPQHGSSVTLEGMKPNYTKGDNVKFASSAWYLSGRYQATPSLAVAGELPISYFGVDQGSLSETAVGNPYIGIVLDGDNSPVVAEGGIRLPVTDEDKFNAIVNGWCADVDRWTAFYPDLVTVRGRGGMKFNNPLGNVSGRVLLGGSLLIPTGDISDEDPELIGELLAELWFQEQQFQFGLDIAGYTWITESDADFNERSEFQVGMGLAYTLGQIRPGLHLQIPLGDEGFIGRGEIVDYVIGLNVTAFFPVSGPTTPSTP